MLTDIFENPILCVFLLSSLAWLPSLCVIPRSKCARMLSGNCLGEKLGTQLGKSDASLGRNALECLGSTRLWGSPRAKVGKFPWL